MVLSNLSLAAGVVAPSLSAATAFARLPKEKIAPYVLLGVVCLGIGISNLVALTSADVELFAAFDPVSSIALSAVLMIAGFFALTGLALPVVNGRIYIGFVTCIVGSTYALYQHPAAIPFVRCFDVSSSTYAVLAAAMGFSVAISRSEIDNKALRLVGAVVIAALWATLNMNYYSLNETGKLLLHASLLIFVITVSQNNKKYDHDAV